MRSLGALTRTNTLERIPKVTSNTFQFFRGTDLHWVHLRWKIRCFPFTYQASWVGGLLDHHTWGLQALPLDKLDNFRPNFPRKQGDLSHSESKQGNIISYLWHQKLKFLISITWPLCNIFLHCNKFFHVHVFEHRKDNCTNCLPAQLIYGSLHDDLL